MNFSLDALWSGEAVGGSAILQLFLLIAAVLLVNFILRLVINRLQAKVERTTQVWDDALLHAFRGPLGLMVWVLGASILLYLPLMDEFPSLKGILAPGRDVAVIAAIAWFAMRLIRTAEANILDRAELLKQPMDRTTADAVAKLLRVAVVITAVMVAMQTLGFSISGVLAFGGVGGLAVGFAAKDLLANFFGGLMIYLDRPFAVGDWIRSPDKEIEGTVEQIGWRLTRIRTFDKRPLYVPNSVFTNISVENPSRMSHRRIKETIGIRYDDAGRMGDVVEAVKSMLREHPEIDHGQTLIVNFDKFAPSSLDFFIYTFTRTTDWVHYHEVKQDVLLKVIAIIEAHGAECAFPTSTLHLAEPVRMESI